MNNPPARPVSRYTLLALFLMFCCALPVAAGATDQPPPETPKLKEVIEEPPPESQTTAEKTLRKLVKYGPDDRYDRGVPRTSVAGFIRAAKRDDFEQAAAYLDLENLPASRYVGDGPELARKLAVVFNRALWIDMDTLSMDPEGHSEDGLPGNRDLVGQIQAGDRKYDVLLQRVPRGDGIPIWKFSARTVANIPALYSSHGYGPFGEELAQRFPSAPFLGLELWQWIYLLLIASAAMAISFPILRLVSWLIRRRDFPLAEVIARFVNGPLHLVLVVLIARSNIDIIHPSLEARSLFEGRTLLTVVTVWAIIRLANLLRDYWSFRLRQLDREHATALLRHTITTFNIVVVIVAVLVWLDNVGFSVITILAGLGIGGLAIALATQKTIEQFIGAVTLYLSAPVRVGDFCRFGDKIGTVEEIGLRATKVRTLEQTLIAIPNDSFAGMQLENFAGRRRFRFAPRIRLRVDTSADQIRFIVLELQKLLHAHPKVVETPLRVRFVGFGVDSLDIDVHSYIDTSEFDEYLAVAEDLNLRIMDILHAAGAEITLPARIEYQDDIRKPDSAARQKVEQRVAEWKDKGTLGQDLTAEQIAEIRNTIPYPASRT